MKNKSKDNHFCYSCHKEKPVKYIHKLGYDIYRCPACKLKTLDFTQNYESFIHSYYQKGYFTGNKKIRAYSNYAADKPNIIKNAHNILSKVKKLIPKGNVLDVGCAMGFFMEEAEKLGFKAYGIELSDYAAEIAGKKFAERIYRGAVEDFFKNKGNNPVFKNLTFDVIILSDIIEHVKDPRKVLIELKSILNKDGIVVIQTGDADSVWAKLMGKNWHFYAPPQHLYFFSKTTLTDILKQTGYKVVNVYKEGKYVSLEYILHMTQYMNATKLGDVLANLIAKTPLSRIPLLVKLFDNMVIFAKKA